MKSSICKVIDSTTPNVYVDIRPSTTWGVHTRIHVYWGRGIHYRGCTFIPGGVHTRMHMYWGRCIHYRGCMFIPGGVHTRTRVLDEGHPLQGVYLHTWGYEYQDAYVLGAGHPLQGVYLHSCRCAYQDAYLATTSQKYLVT